MVNLVGKSILQKISEPTVCHGGNGLTTHHRRRSLYDSAREFGTTGGSSEQPQRADPFELLRLLGIAFLGTIFRDAASTMLMYQVQLRPLICGANRVPTKSARSGHWVWSGWFSLFFPRAVERCCAKHLAGSSVCS